MKLINLTPIEYNNYVYTHNYSSFYQSLEYARFMEEEGFDYDLIGLKDAYDNIIAASLILLRKIDNKHLFGYAPRGFLIDYNDKELVKDFAKTLSKYYKKRNVIFIKINPNIIISKYDKNTNKFFYNDNFRYIDYFKKNKFQELKRSKYFESVIPSFSPIINLKTFAFNKLNKNVRNKISKCYRKGLSIDKGDIKSLEELYPLVKNKTKKEIKYYDNLLRSFEKSKNIDIFLIKVNFEEFLINTKAKYQTTLEKSNILNKIVTLKNSEKYLNLKMQIDRELETYKNDIMIATNGLSKNKYKVVGGAIVIKHKNKATVFVSGYDKNYRSLNINDFLYYKLIEYYKYVYDFLDIDGYCGDLSDSNPYIGLNNFKKGFNPEIYEYIGEFDIIFKKNIYNKISSNGTLSKLFRKIKQ